MGEQLKYYLIRSSQNLEKVQTSIPYFCTFLEFYSDFCIDETAILWFPTRVSFSISGQFGLG